MKALVTASNPKTFTSINVLMSETRSSSSGPFSDTPALFTSPKSSLPTSSLTLATAWAMESSSVTSSLRGVSDPDASSLRASPSCSFRTPAKTRYPWALRRRVVALPMPLEAPVTRTAR